ncbi:MAG: peptidase [Rhodothermales bacterium]|nr:peptidase [Rhodothermales bacterium]
MPPSGRILFIFVDGIGLGADDALANPFANPWAGFEALSSGRRWTSPGASAGVSEPDSLFRGIDACLGMNGLPQSGTGQASLFTGVNCVELAGRHYGPFPHSASRDVLREQSLFARLADRGAAFANAYPPRFFNWVNRTKRWPTTTRACLDAGIRIRTIEDLQAGRGIAADVTGAGLANELGLPVDVVGPEEAGDRLLALSSDHAFTMMEVFHTDKAGHAMNAESAHRILRPLDGLLAHLASHRPGDLTIVLSSDHGNLEDLSIKTHTRNEVPLAVLGPGAGLFESVVDLTGVAPAVEAVVRGPAA